MKEASEKRNKFLHEGNQWVTGEDFTEKCLESLPDLLTLHKELNNLYVQSNIRY